MANYKPQLTNAARPATLEVEAYNERGEMVPTSIAGEHPLTLYVDKREIVTLMTLGAAPEALAIGFLRNQRLVESIDEIESVQVDWEVNAVVVTKYHGLKDLEAKKGFTDLSAGKERVDHVDVTYNAGHPGVAEPHYHIAVWYVSRDQVAQLK